jgi:hypothetical protein
MDADHIEKTIELWQPRSGHLPSEEDAREMTENVVGFFKIILEWDRKDRDAGPAKVAPARPGKRGITRGHKG